MKLFFLITLAAIFFSACAMSANLRPGATPLPDKTVYVHQQRNIHFTQALRERETRQFLVLLNRYRREKGLAPLAEDPLLQKAAQWMSADMALNDYMGHTDSQGRDSFKRLADFGYTLNTYKGENVAAGQETAGDVLAAWKKSPEHNANMLNSHFTVTGVGLTYHRKSEYGWFWANTFGGEKSRSR